MTAELASVIGIALLGALVWHLRLRVAMRRRVPEASSVADISIIVPARNEAHNLPALLDSLAALEPAPREIIVVDDHSTDGTGDIARARAVRVVNPPPLPADWNGKPWACAAGARVASGEYLLFTDADTVHASDSLARVSAELAQVDAELLSVIPTHTARRLWERLQGVYHLLLLIATGAGARTARGERRFTIGQYILVSRFAYARVGGHGVVARRVAEDLGLGRAVAETGGKVVTMFAPGLLRVRMYPRGLRAFMRGWRRSFHEGLASAGVLASLELTAVMGWLVGAPLITATSAIRGDLTGVIVGLCLYAAACVAVGARQRQCGDFPRWSAPLYPMFVILFTVVSTQALIDRVRGADVTWKGRRVISEQGTRS